jgi:histone-lysine N-methyltransferase SETMAR
VLAYIARCFALKKFNLHYFPYSLDNNQIAEWVAFSSELLEVLTSQRRNRFDHIITGDEFWFDFEYPYAEVSIPSRDEVLERIKKTVDIKKCLISIIWSINEIHSLLNIPKTITYNSKFFCNSIVPDLVEIAYVYSQRKILKNIMTHLDDAHPHNSRKSTECLEQFRARTVPHLAYSPDLAPCDFFLFESVKSKLPGLVIRSREDLIYEIRRIFEEILKVTLISVHVSWIKWLK